MGTTASPDNNLKRTEERLLEERTPGGRLLQLDALRGIAAVCVVFHHWRLAFETGIPHFWLVPLVGGSQAVMLFFSLSGFVLSLPYMEGKRRPYWPYLIRRFWRIYVPFAGAIALSAAGAIAFHGYHLPLTKWYYETWQTPVTGTLLIQQLLMVPLVSLNTAFWTLSVEVQFSVIMPLLAIAARRLPAAGAVIVLLAWGGTLPLVRLSGTSMPPAWFFAQYGPLFFAGAILAKYRVRVATTVKRAGNSAWLILAASFVLYCDYHRTDWPMYSFLDNYLSFVSGLGALGLITCAISMPQVARLLEHSVPEYLGRVSYSLYLVHSVVIFAVLDLLFGRLPLPALTVVMLVAALCLGHTFCILIEEPSMRMGKRLAL